MQKPNAEPHYEQNPFERLLLKTGWRFRGLQLFSSGPWKAWAFFVLAVFVGAILYGLALSVGFDPMGLT
jgi:hypothetical protein